MAPLLVKNFTSGYKRKTLTNTLFHAIIQSQVEGNRTRAGEGKLTLLVTKWLQKKDKKKFQKGVDKWPDVCYTVVKIKEGRPLR